MHQKANKYISVIGPKGGLLLGQKLAVIYVRTLLLYNRPTTFSWERPLHALITCVHNLHKPFLTLIFRSQGTLTKTSSMEVNGKNAPSVGGHWEECNAHHSSQNAILTDR